MKTPAVTQCAKTILILSMFLLAVGGSLAAQSGTKDRVRKRAHRIFAAQTGPDQVTLAWDEVPGATEYRIYLPDPNKPGPPAPGSRPTMSFGGSGRRAIVMGVERMAGGAYLEALGQGEVLYRGTFNAVARAPLARPTAPAAVQALETGETEVTLSWNPVPGATAYMIGRAVGGSGLRMLCDVCPPSGEFVDTSATPGLEHSYMVAAIFPLGISTRTPSNRLTVGAAQLAAATAGAPTAPVWDKPMSTGTPVAGTAADNTNVGASAGIPTTGSTGGCPTGTGAGTGTETGTATGTGTPTGWTPGGMPAANTQTSNSPGSMPSGVSGASVNTTNPFTPGGTPAAAMTGQQLPTPITTTQPTTIPTATPITTTPTTAVHTATPVTATAQTTTSSTANSAVSPPTAVTAKVTGPGMVLVTWQASPTTGVTQYQINRRVNGGAWELLNIVDPATLAYSDTFFPATMFASGPVRVIYSVRALRSIARSPAAETGDLMVQPIVPTAGLPSTGTPANVCRLDYQRADNMWAAEGRPDGLLGTETISLSPAQNKVFITDWKYEKTRNDGSNYYGSHLRIATNSGSRTIRLQIRATELTLQGFSDLVRTGSNTFWIRMDPGSTKLLKADLMEVFCEK